MLFRITSISSLVVMCAVLATFFTPQFPAGLLCVVFPILSVMWILCVAVKNQKRKIIDLMVLWALIDLSILLMMLSIAVSLGDLNKLGGADVVLLFTYAPVVVPVGFCFAFLLSMLDLVSYFFALTTCHTASESAWCAWGGLSLIAAIQSCGILFLKMLAEASGQ